jgi:hypothetical protein
MVTDAQSLPSGFDPLVAEAKQRMRRRRVLLAMLAMLAAAGVLTLILRPFGAPGTSRVTSNGANRNALAHVRVRVDASERMWLRGIRRVHGDASGPTPRGVAELRRTVVAAVDKSGATVARLRVWPRADAVEVVLATRMNPATYLKHHVRPVFDLDERSFNYIKVVDGQGSRIVEWYELPHSDMVGVSYRLNNCIPLPVDYPMGSPPCPVK